MCPKTQSWIPAAFTAKTTQEAASLKSCPSPTVSVGHTWISKTTDHAGLRLRLKFGFKFISYLFAMGHCGGQNCDGSEFIP